MEFKIARTDIIHERVHFVTNMFKDWRAMFKVRARLNLEYFLVLLLLLFAVFRIHLSLFHFNDQLEEGVDDIHLDEDAMFGG